MGEGEVIVAVHRVQLHPDDGEVAGVLDGALHLDVAADVRHDLGLSDEGDGGSPVLGRDRGGGGQQQEAGGGQGPRHGLRVYSRSGSWTMGGPGWPGHTCRTSSNVCTCHCTGTVLAAGAGHR